MFLKGRQYHQRIGGLPATEVLFVASYLFAHNSF